MMPSLRRLNYSEILQKNAELASQLGHARYDVRILSNIVLSQAHEILEFALRSNGVPAVVQSGDYDNVVQESLKCQDAKLVVIAIELSNVIEGLQFEIDLFDEAAAEAVFQKSTSEIDLVFENLKATPLILFNRFSSLAFTSADTTPGPLEHLARRLNDYLESKNPLNVRVVDIDKVLSRVGIRASVDMRYFYSSRALYSIEFLKAYVEFVLPLVLAVNGKMKKALIFDCDNTLWKGILGEDGEAGIEMAADSRTGAIFAEVQSIALAWSKRGVLLGLCSKNNPEDVDRVLASHTDMRIRDANLVVKRVNWQDKVTNLQEIARELQIGLDSIVFVDDSPFEAEMVRAQLPAVEVLQVPKNLSEYPGLLREHAGWFLSGSRSKEDLQKTEMYQAQAARVAAQAGFAGLDGYLESLGIQITVSVDDAAVIPRLSQLSQKTNQFNLTTARYTEAEMRAFVESPDAAAISISVRDRFGDSGIVGLAIVKLSRSTRSAEIDTFLMSCRVIGRNIEYAVMDYLVAFLRSQGMATVEARYLPTAKNEQVREFYDRSSFTLTKDDKEMRTYALDIAAYAPRNFSYLQLIDGRAN